MKGVPRKSSNISQRSYDYERKENDEPVQRKASTKAGSITRDSTNDYTSTTPGRYQDLYLLQEIAFEQPEIENTLSNTLSSVKQRNSFAVPAWFFDVVIPLCHFLLAGAFVFCMGLVTGFFLSSPTGYSGSFLWKTSCPNASQTQNKLFVLLDDQDANTLKVKGTFNLSHYVQNPTLFSASLSSHVWVYYLPMSKDLQQLNEQQCLPNYSENANQQRRNPQQDGADVLKTRIEDVFNIHGNRGKPAPTLATDPSSKDSEATQLDIDEGTLVTIAHVDSQKEHGEDGHSDSSILHVFDSSMFNMFTSHLLLANKLHFVADIDESLNEVSYLVTINRSIDKTGEDAQLVEQLLRDCRKGQVLLQLETTHQSFKTIFFGGEMLPMRFFPLALPCDVIQNDRSKRELEDIFQSQRKCYIDQFNVLLHMDAMYGKQCPLAPPETDEKPATEQNPPGM